MSRLGTGTSGSTGVIDLVEVLLGRLIIDELNVCWLGQGR
jgi:hypothetical protein